MFKQLNVEEKEAEEYYEKAKNIDNCFKCKRCEGTGLKNFKKGHYWSGEYCDFCDGIGLFYIFELVKKRYNLKDFYIDENKNKKDLKK